MCVSWHRPAAAAPPIAGDDASGLTLAGRAAPLAQVRLAQAAALRQVIFHREDALVGGFAHRDVASVLRRTDGCELTFELSVGTLYAKPVHLRV